MGGFVEVGDSVETGVPQRRAGIEKVQAELRHRYDVRAERRRELEFLEEGGNPLDFKIGNAASTSIQTTSLIDHSPELFGTSGAKDSFAFTVSTHGDSVESSGRPGDQSTVETNSADTIMLFDDKNYSVECDRISGQPNKSNADLRDHFYNLDGSLNAKDNGESGAVGLEKKLYNRRRFRSRPSRDTAKSSSSDVSPALVINESSLHSSGGDFKGLVSDREHEQKASINGDLKPTCAVSVAVCRTAPSTTQVDEALDVVMVVKSTTDPIKDEGADSGKASYIMKSFDSETQKLGSHEDLEKQSIQELYAFRAPEEVGVESHVCRASLPVTVVETQGSCDQMKGSSTEKLHVNGTPNIVMTDNTRLDSNILELVSSCTHTRLSLDKNSDNNVCTNARHVDTSGDSKELTSAVGGNECLQVDHETKEKDILVDCGSLQQTLKENGFMMKPVEEVKEEVFGMHHKVDRQGQIETNNQDMAESMDVDGCGVSETGKDTNVLFNLHPREENLCKVGPDGYSSPPIAVQLETEPSVEVSSSVFVEQTLSATDLKPSRDEDSILEQAQIIEAKRKRIAQLSFSDTPGDSCPKSHWGFVLEEMAWLANDFAQERLWKISVASQVGRRVSLLSRLRFQEQNSRLEGQKVARFLARAVMEFWHSLEGKSQGQELQCHNRDYSRALQDYALRFRRNDTSEDRHFKVETPVDTDRDPDLAIIDISLDTCSREENVLYVIPPGAMARYRHSVESCAAKYKKNGSNLPEELMKCTSDAVADLVYEDDDRETSASVAIDSSKSLKHSQKKLKISTKACGGRILEGVADSPFLQCADKKVGNQQSVFMRKCPDNGFNVSIPTKRVRTSNRQRVLGYFGAGTSYALGPAKTDASSGDTNSFQDDQSTLDGVPHAVNSLEFESARDFGKRLSYDSAEPEKKKARFSGSAYEQKWLIDSNFLNNQRDHSRKRLSSSQFASNSGSGLFGHHNAKKSKMVRQSIDNAIESSMQFGGSAPSHISNPNKLRKYTGGGRDGGRKTKMLKIPACQSSSESLWSQFEEQALVVLVHDLGPNWELVSDAVNSTFLFKCIFRSAQECKERHKQLMDAPSGDGADSAEDSGTSQPYSSTLRGIPKGSARQLFQQLQGPMEEDILKFHFEKITMIGQKLHCRKKQEPKQIQPPHGSHMVALAQVYPNNLNGGPILTPLDLCDATGCGSDVLPLGYPDMHSSVLPTTSNQGIMTTTLTASGSNSPAPVSSNLSTDNFSSSSAPLNASIRDGRYALPKSTNKTIEEQRIQQYNQMLSGRNVSQSNLSSPGQPIPPGSSNGGPIAGGGNRIARPGFQGIASSSVSNAGITVSSPTPVGCGQGNSSRPRDASHITRPPTQNPDHQQRQMPVQGPSYGAMPSAFPNQRASSPYQQSQAMTPQQLQSIGPRHPHIKRNIRLPNPQYQAYAIRVAKERQLQQRILQRQQQQQQFEPHNALLPHIRSQAQLPVSSPPHNNSSRNTPPPVALYPLPLNSHMAAMPQSPNSSGMTNQGKQRRQTLQQFAQSDRQNLQQQRQQVKVSKGLGRGNMAVHQKTETDELTTEGAQGGHVSSGKPLVRQSSNLSQPVQRTYGGGQVSSISKPCNSDGINQRRVSSGTSAMDASGQQKYKLVNQNKPDVEKVNGTPTSGSTSSTCTEPSRQLGQGQAEQHSAGNLPCVSNDVISTQRQQQQQTPVHLQPPPPPNVFQQPEQPLSASKLPTQLKGSVNIRPPESI